MSYNLRGVIEEDPTTAITQQITKAVFGAVVNPPLDKHFIFNLALILLLGVRDALELEVVHGLRGLLETGLLEPCLSEVRVVKIGLRLLHFIVELGPSAAQVLELFDIVGRGRTGEGRERHRAGNLGLGVQKRVGHDIRERRTLGWL